MNYPEYLGMLHNQKMKIGKYEKLTCNLNDKKILRYTYLKFKASSKSWSKTRRRVFEPNYHATKWFSENILAIKMKKTKAALNKPVYLGLAILDLSQTQMFWYDYIKVKYSDNIKLCYNDTDSFIIHIKKEDFFKDIKDDVEKRFDTSNYEVKKAVAKREI